MEATASRRNYPALHEFNPSIRRHAPARSRRLILFSLGASPKRIVRKQYYFRPSDRGFAAWDVDRLVRLSRELPRIQVPLRLIRELDEPFWFGSGSDAATCRAIVEHARLIDAADLSSRLSSPWMGASWTVCIELPRRHCSATRRSLRCSLPAISSRTLWTFSQRTSRMKILLMKHRQLPNQAMDRPTDRSAFTF